MRMMALAAVLALVAHDAAAQGFAGCVNTLKSAAISAGVDRAIAESAFEGAQPDEYVLRQSTAQPEFETPIWDYFAFLVDEERIADGLAMLEEHGDLLARVEERFGVNRYVIAALWGIESDYGREAGDLFLPHALATLVCEGSRRQSFWRGELIAALKLVDRGDLELGELYGSWAGAFGQTQFIPTTYQRLAVDFDGDGRRDLVRSIADALGSAANYLSRAGWTRGASWLIEVKVPPGYRGTTGRTRRASLSTWGKRGVVRADGTALGGGAVAGLLLPAGPKGPGFLVFPNFDALHAYNQSDAYALAISHLADRLADYPALRTPWPTDDPGLSRAERLDLQKRLIASGYDIGEADGKIGPITRAGIREAEEDLGMKPTGRPGRRIYERLGGV